MKESHTLGVYGLELGVRSPLTGGYLSIRFPRGATEVPVSIELPTRTIRAMLRFEKLVNRSGDDDGRFILDTNPELPVMSRDNRQRLEELEGAFRKYAMDHPAAAREILAQIMWKTGGAVVDPGVKEQLLADLATDEARERVGRPPRVIPEPLGPDGLDGTVTDPFLDLRTEAPQTEAPQVDVPPAPAAPTAEDVAPEVPTEQHPDIEPEPKTRYQELADAHAEAQAATERLDAPGTPLEDGDGAEPGVEASEQPVTSVSVFEGPGKPSGAGRRRRS